MEIQLFCHLATSLIHDDDDETWRLPVASNGEPCPFPLMPFALVGSPIRFFHCPFCDDQQVVGYPHLDWKDLR